MIKTFCEVLIMFSLVAIKHNANCVNIRSLRAGDTHGDACVGDFDGDGVVDSKDVCPSNPKISRTDFTKYTSLVLDAVALERDKPLWRVNKKVGTTTT